MTRSRITTALLVLEIALTVLLFGGAVTQAFTLQDIGVSMPQSLDVEYISQNQGLDGSQYQTCSGDLLALFNENLGAQMERWMQDTARALLQSMTSQLQTKALCMAQNGIAKLTTLALGGGGRFFGALSECNNISASDMAEVFKQDVKDRLTQNFLVNCTTSVSRNIVTTSAMGIIQTQGLDGGMAAAVDWSYMQSVRPAEIAQRQWWAVLANTDICPWFRQDVLDQLGVPQSYREKPPPINSMGYRTDERPPFEVRGACSLPPDFDISDISDAAYTANGGYLLLAALEEPQNNPNDFYEMALTEFESLKTERVSAATNQLIAGGGFTGTYGECARDPNGKCFDDGNMKQVPGAVRDIAKTDLEAAYATLNSATGEQGLMEDIAAQIQTRLLNMANAPLPLNLQLGAERTQTNMPAYSPPASSPGASPTPDPRDPACIGSDITCECARGNNTYETMASGTIASAIAATIQIYPAYFVAGTNQIVPGTDYQLIGYGVCERIGGGGALCHPHPTKSDFIVMDFGGTTVSFDIITDDGYIRTDGGSPELACPAGVQ